MSSGMYEAIVFLPLLGAVIAGLIALVGARKPPSRRPARRRRMTITPRRGAGRPCHGTPRPESTTPKQEVAEIDRRLASRRARHHHAVGALLGAVLLRLRRRRLQRARRPRPAVQLHHLGRPQGRLGAAHRSADRRDAGGGDDVSALVHLYSIGYMADDPHQPRFFSYLSFFTFAMLMLVTADNLVQLFFGWEGVGLACYLLIGFWYHKPEANAAAIKAFIVNRVGDFGFALGIFAVFLLTGSIDFDTIFAQAPDARRQDPSLSRLRRRCPDR